ncbi:MAG TPA: amidohydrolase family protein, partial [Acidobacteriota bacterium]|nr:amidohydrolase family protein [Acidobacteriota bacterium]
MKRVPLKEMTAVLLSLFLFACSAPSHKEKADLALLDARIWTADPERPWAEALAVSGGRITAVGSSEDIQALVGDETQVLEAEGTFVTPGFIDSHIHFLQGGANLLSVQLRDAATPEEFVQRIADYAQELPSGEWILGGDWDHERWGGELPKAEWIDEVTPENPVMINRLDGHMVLANSLAMELAEVGPESEEVEGGTIVRDDQGRPTGIFKDNAMDLIGSAVPEPTLEQITRAFEAAQKHVTEQGVTSVHHMGSWDDLKAFRDVQRMDLLGIRIYAAVPLHTWQRLELEIKNLGRGDEWLRIGGLKG